MKDKATVKYSFKVTIPIMASFLVIGTAFGLLLESKGYGWWWAALMSVGIYAGSMQFVTINLITSGASLLTTAVMTLMVNLRHLFYGIAMLEKYKNIGKVKPYVIYALPDETFSLVCSPDLPDDVDGKKYCFLVSLFNQIYWVTGSIIGGIIGSAITIDTAGIDFAMTALFTVIFVEQWEKNKAAPAGSYRTWYFGYIASHIRTGQLPDTCNGRNYGAASHRKTMDNKGGNR